MPTRPVEKMLRKLKPKEEKPTLEKREAQMIADEAKAMLKRRQREFIEKIKKHTVVDMAPKKIIKTIIIKLPELGQIAELEFIIDRERAEIYVAKINVGEFRAENDSLRGLGIGTYLLGIVKGIAKKQKMPKITLLCVQAQIPYYKRLGFVISERETHTKYYKMTCFV